MAMWWFKTLCSRSALHFQSHRSRGLWSRLPWLHSRKQSSTGTGASGVCILQVVLTTCGILAVICPTSDVDCVCDVIASDYLRNLLHPSTRVRRSFDISMDTSVDANGEEVHTINGKAFPGFMAPPKDRCASGSHPTS